MQTGCLLVRERTLLWGVQTRINGVRFTKWVNAIREVLNNYVYKALQKMVFYH